MVHLHGSRSKHVMTRRNWPWRSKTPWKTITQHTHFPSLGPISGPQADSVVTNTEHLEDSKFRAVDTRDKQPLAFSLVPSEKRARQRAMRQVRVAQEQSRAK